MTIIDWLKNRNVTAHSISVGVVAACALIVSDQQLRSQVLGLFEVHPKIGTALVSLAGIITTYANSQKKE